MLEFLLLSGQAYLPRSERTRGSRFVEEDRDDPLTPRAGPQGIGGGRALWSRDAVFPFFLPQSQAYRESHFPRSVTERPAALGRFGGSAFAAAIFRRPQQGGALTGSEVAVP